MIKKILKVLKKVIMSALIIYAFNMIAAPINTIIPINTFTILGVTVLGLPAMFGLILFSVMFF